MPERQTVLTPERFATGLTFGDYLAQVKVNKDRFEQFYQTGRFTREDGEFFRRAGAGPDGIAKVLVMAEDWCPDAFRGVPVFARIAEASGAEMRIFPRDKNLDLMNEFLNQGKHMSIPVVAFFTSDLREIGRWIERPQVATRERAEIEAQVRKEMPGVSDADLRIAIRERTQPRYPAWQQETVREIRQILSEKLRV